MVIHLLGLQRDPAHEAEGGIEIGDSAHEGLRIEAQRQRLAATTDPVARVPIQAEIARAEERLARRQDMRATLERYRAALRELQGSAEELADRVVNLSAGGVSALYEEFDAEAPIRRIAELRASVAALEEVLGTEQTQEN